MADTWFSFLLLLLVLPSLAISLLKKLKGSKPTKHRTPPGPPKLPLIGNLHQFDGSKPHEYLMKLSQKYGPLISLKLGTVPVLVISSAEMAKEALKDNDIAFSGRPSLVAAKKLSYGGLDIGFAPYGEYWREMKKLTVLHLLSLKKVQSFRPIQEDEIARLLIRISDLSSASESINIGSTMVSLTSRIICRIAFGKKGDSDNGVKDGRSAHEILHDTESVLAGFFVSDYFPRLGWIDKFTGMLPRLEKNFQELDSFYQELIEEHLVNSEKNESLYNNNILHMLIQLKEDQSSTIDLTWNHIKSILTSIFLAATSSSAATITWAMTSLMKNPTTLQKLKAEIRDSFGSKARIEPAEQLGNLPYLNAVIKETLRLHIPAPLLLPRQTTENCTLGGYEIKANTFVFVNAWAIARDPEIWENPTEFKPERFLNRNVDLVNGQHFELIPFGSGRRGCPGANLAIATVQLVLANLLNFFNWELPYGMKTEDIDIEGLPGISVHPKNPLCLLAKKRV